MKKFLFFLTLMMVILAAPLLVLASDGSSPPNPIGLEMFASVAALAAGIVGIMQIIKPILGLGGIFNDLVSWLIGILLAFIGWYFSLGIFVGLPWYTAIIIGLFAAFTANKSYDLFARNYN